ncbi:hypothetical protein ACH3XW_15145 [Acanthocheilonema viteae]
MIIPKFKGRPVTAMIAIRAIIIAIIATGRPLNFQPVPKLPIPFIQPCFLVIYLPELLTLETSCCEYGEGYGIWLLIC